MNGEAKLRKLIDAVYDVTVDRSRWQTLGNAIAPMFNGHSCAVQLHEPRIGRSKTLSVTANITDQAVNAYESYYREQDAWTLRASVKGLSTVFISQDLIGDKEFLASEFFHDWCRPIDLAQVVGLVFPVSGDVLGGIGVHRPPGGKPFGEEQRRLMERFFPHLRRAMQICGLLDLGDAARLGAAAALEACGAAVMVVDADCRVVFVSSTAERQLGGDELKVTGGRLAADGVGLSSRIERLVREAARTSAGRGAEAGGTVVIRRVSGSPLSVTVSPLRDCAIPGLSGELALVLIRSADSVRSPVASMLAGLFDLTVAESQLATMLADGKTTQDFARLRAISPHTANVHLKNLMRKTRTTRQAELVSLVLRTSSGLSEV